MQFTKEQFEEIGPFYLDDYPIDDKDQDLMLKVFNHLPSHLQGLAVQWGCDDTVFRDDVFVYLLENQLGMTPTVYYNSPKSRDYFKSHIPLPVNFEKLKEGN